jgi:hypothetical protein
MGTGQRTVGQGETMLAEKEGQKSTKRRKNELFLAADFRMAPMADPLSLKAA